MPDHDHTYLPGNWYAVTDTQDRNDCIKPGCEAHQVRPHQEWNEEQ